MDVSQDHIDTLTKNLARYEQQVRRRAWLSAIVPSIFGLLLLGYTAWQIQVYGKELAGVQIELTKQSGELIAARSTLQAMNGQLDQTDQDLRKLQVTSTAAATSLESKQKQLDQLGGQLTQTTDDLREATDYLYDANAYAQYRIEVDPFASKDLFSAHETEKQAQLLNYVLGLQLQSVHYDPTGFSKEEGFNSRNFTVYVMKQCGLISPDYQGDAGPESMLHVNKTGIPLLGDIVTDGLGSGFAMFYFDVDGQQFLIGMTTQNILPLKPEFIKNPKYYHVPYDAPIRESKCPPGGPVILE